MKICCISDTHSQLNKIIVPSGDLLIHAGDLTFNGTTKETIKELDTLQKHSKNFQHIVLISGNHDWLGEKQPLLMKKLCEDRGLIYLDHSSVKLLGFNIFGSPYTPEFYNWAFNVQRGEDIRKKWDQIPRDTDILVTHGPPHRILDWVDRDGSLHVGCEELREVVEVIRPKLHIFGHIHCAYGEVYYGMDPTATYYINASSCSESYNPTNPPIVIDL